MDHIITSYVPFHGYNVYSKNVMNLLDEAGYRCYPIKKILTSPKLFLKCRILNLNWFEEVRDLKTYVIRVGIIYLFKLSGKKIVYTLHNKHPHEQNKGGLSYQLMKLLCRKSDAIIGLCDETKSIVDEIDPKCVNKVRIIPHPNYIDNYAGVETKDIRNKFGFNSNDLVFLFLGVISKYKNLDMLIDTFSKNQFSMFKLIIAGNPDDIEYKSKLMKLCDKTNNIKYDFRHIPEEDIPDYYHACNVVVLPYQKDSYLNSGAVYLSFSLKKTVICPLIGSIKDLKDKSFVYTYDYADESNHCAAFIKTLEKIKEEYSIDTSTINKKGNAAYLYVAEKHSNQLIRDMYKQLYNNLC